MENITRLREPENDPDVTIGQELVTPERAREWLASLPEQRPLRPMKVEQHKRAMRSGEWWPKAKPLMLDKEGRLIEGMHRLRALVETGLPQWFVVYRGVDSAMFMDVDDGQAIKTLNDVLIAKGVARGTSAMAAQVVRMAWRASQGHSVLDDRHQPRNREGWALFAQNRHPIEESVRLARGCERVLRGAGLLAYHFFRNIEDHPEKVRAFAHRLRTGEDTWGGDPALLLRNWEMELARKQIRIFPHEHIKALSASVNAAVAGKKARTWGDLGVKWVDPAKKARKSA
jgi:hypothetical protein